MSGSISLPYNPFAGAGAGGNNSNSSGGAPAAAVVNQAIFSNNILAASKIINEDQIAAQEASQAVKESKNSNIDPQVEDITFEKITELTNAAKRENTQEENDEEQLDAAEQVAETKLVEAELALAESAPAALAESAPAAPAALAAPAASAESVPAVERRRSSGRISRLPKEILERLREAQENINRIAQSKEDIKLRRLEKIKKKEAEMAKKAAAAAAAVNSVPFGAEQVEGSQRQGTPLRRIGTSESSAQVPNSLGRATAAAAKENSTESLRIQFSGMNDKSALNQLWPYNDGECCYLCGFPTHTPTGYFPDGNHTIKLLHGNRSPEHVIPMTAGGAAYIGILKRGDDIRNERLKNLLRKELRPSHYWCNEVKQNMLFITWPKDGRISFNKKVVSDFLCLLYYGSVTGTRFFDKNYCKVYCRQDNKLYPHLVHYFCKTRGITFQTWYDASMVRIEQIINDIIETIYTLAPINTFDTIKERFNNYGKKHWDLREKKIKETLNICYLANFTAAGIITVADVGGGAGGDGGGGGGVKIEIPKEYRNKFNKNIKTINISTLCDSDNLKEELEILFPRTLDNYENFRNIAWNEIKDMCHENGLYFPNVPRNLYNERTRKHRPRKTRKRNRKQRKTRKV